MSDYHELYGIVCELGEAVEKQRWISEVIKLVIRNHGIINSV